MIGTIAPHQVSQLQYFMKTIRFSSFRRSAIPAIILSSSVAGKAAIVATSFGGLNVNADGTQSGLGGFAGATYLGSNSGDGTNTYTLNATISNIDLDQDSIDDSFSFSVTFTGSDSAGVATISGGNFIGVADALINAGETLNMTIQITSATLSNVAMNTQIVVDGITNFDTNSFGSVLETNFTTASGTTFLAEGGTNATGNYDQISDGSFASGTIVSGTGASFPSTTLSVEVLSGSTDSFQLDDFDLQFTVSSVPEPSALLLVGVTPLILLRRRRTA